VKVHEALAAVMDEVRAVHKGEKHGQGWSFRGVDAVVNAVAPALRRHGVVVTPRVLSHEVTTVPAPSGKAQRSVALTVRYTFTGPEGDHMESVVFAEQMDGGDKAAAKAMSVALRTCLLQTLMLPTDDVDPDHDVHEVALPAAPVLDDEVPVFDPGDPGTWPDQLTQAQAKRVVLAYAGGDRDRAKAAWSDVEDGPWSANAMTEFAIGMKQ
jgi:hypothetical protein